MNTRTIKEHGIHYTPPELAAFLADVTVAQLVDHQGDLEILDPACGDGALLYAIAQSLSPSLRERTTLVGLEMDPLALDRARQRLDGANVYNVKLAQQDFLLTVGSAGGQRTLFDLDDSPDADGLQYDVIIANPPYVRTQVMGASKAQQLAKKFGLTGRVDLYHAFTTAMTAALKPGGVLGLLTSNRFLSVKSGAAIRHVLQNSFCLREIYDLGDTKLFTAAVLPVILIGEKRGVANLPVRTNTKAKSTLDNDPPASNPQQCRFERIYQHRNGASSDPSAPVTASVLDAIKDRSLIGLVNAAGSLYHIERGVLALDARNDVWSLSNHQYRGWLEQVEQCRRYTFEDVAKIRVGIKTTADEVFIRNDWTTLSAEETPEAELIRPLVRHFDASRWNSPSSYPQSVLYPHTVTNGRRCPINLSDYPKATRYLEKHRERLTRRHYVISSGRQWYEIWVPHNPADWAQPKIVFPDIAEEPRFFLDRSGAVVNGDCYWMTLRHGFDDRWLLLILAVANSSFITQYYDIAFHNKLYAGRRRFMTQYVRQFPLPDVDSKSGTAIVKLAAHLVEASEPEAERLAELDSAVWEAFGLRKEAVR